MDFRRVFDKPKNHTQKNNTHKRRELLRYDSGTIPGASWVCAE